jgi:cyclic-di-AMP phosphodiesterase PgpH
LRKYQLPPGLFPQPVEKNVSGNQILKILLLAFCMGLIATFLLPNQGIFPFKYAVGNPWNFKNLQAPFDFEVLRPRESVKEELAEIESQHAPYYLLNTEKVRTQKRLFAKLLEDRVRLSRNDVQYAELVANAGAYLNFGQELLDKMYKIGVNSMNDPLAEDDPGAKIWLVSGNNSEKLISIQDVLSPSEAANFLSDSLPFSNLRQPEFILPLLEQSIAPNIVYSDSLTLVTKRRKIAQVVSTGISVRKGEKIINQGEIVEQESLQKLDSLAQRYTQPIGFKEMLGYCLVFFGMFFGLFLWIFVEKPRIFEEKISLILLLSMIVGTLAFIKFGNRVGVGVPLILPICGIPLFLYKIWNTKIALAVWFGIILVAAFGLDWGISWFVLQLITGFGLFLLFSSAKSQKVQVISALIVSFLAVLFWLAMGWCHRIPESVESNEVPFFILIATFLALGAQRLGVYFLNNFMLKTVSLPNE